ncbi:GNAT family N-acetyltransferase, partial [Curvivirga aplysinae]|uniref:hypothetical protein n=1 Tax=Curvivirga aplysinae TaxID=2529852 RepID=UPI001C3FC7D3
DWLQCQQLRAAAFLPTEPYEEEFDNKDFCMVIHLLAKDNDMPVACMRLSLVSVENGGSIHWGRLATLPSSAKSRLSALNAITDFAQEYCINFGFKKIIGEVSDERLIRYWEKKGFLLSGQPPIWYGDRAFMPMYKTFE